MQDIIDAIVKDMRDRPDAWTLNGPVAQRDFDGKIVEVISYFGSCSALINGIEEHNYAPRIEQAMQGLENHKKDRKLADLRKALNLEG